MKPQFQRAMELVPGNAYLTPHAFTAAKRRARLLRRRKSGLTPCRGPRDKLPSTVLFDFNLWLGLAQCNTLRYFLHPEPSLPCIFQRRVIPGHPHRLLAWYLHERARAIQKTNTALKNTALWEDEKENFLQRARVRAGHLAGRWRSWCLLWRHDLLLLLLRNPPCLYWSNLQAASMRETTFFRFWDKSGEQYSAQRLSALSGGRLWAGEWPLFPAKSAPSHR